MHAQQAIAQQMFYNNPPPPSRKAPRRPSREGAKRNAEVPPAVPCLRMRGAAGAAMLLLASGASAGDKPSRPNFVLFLQDDQDYLGGAAYV